MRIIAIQKTKFNWFVLWSQASPNYMQALGNFSSLLLARGMRLFTLVPRKNPSHVGIQGSQWQSTCILLAHTGCYKKRRMLIWVRNLRDAKGMSVAPHSQTIKSSKYRFWQQFVTQDERKNTINEGTEVINITQPTLRMGQQKLNNHLWLDQPPKENLEQPDRKLMQYKHSQRF